MYNISHNILKTKYHISESIVLMMGRQTTYFSGLNIYIAINIVSVSWGDSSHIYLQEHYGFS